MTSRLTIARLAVRLRLRPRQVRWALLTVHTCATSDLWLHTDERQRAADIVLAAELVETNLQNYANGNNPESLRLPHDAVGWDHGSVGILQQQVGGAPNSTANWGTTAECMNVPHAVRSFLRILHGKGWEASNGQLAQAVQGSAFPDRYAVRDAQAVQIRRTLWRYATTGATPSGPKAPRRPVNPAHNPKAGAIVTVRKGDDFTVIARRYRVSTADLLAANPGAGHPSGNRSMIWPGDHLRLPS